MGAADIGSPLIHWDGEYIFLSIIDVAAASRRERRQSVDGLGSFHEKHPTYNG